MRQFIVLVIFLFTTTFVFSQTIYQGKGADVSDLAFSIVADSDNYSGDEIVIDNYVFPHLQFRSGIAYFEGNPWFGDPKTAWLDDSSNIFHSNNIDVYFHPQKDDREALKLVVQMKGKYYNGPQVVKIKAKAYKTKFPHNPQEYIVILIEELNITGVVYKGEIPDTLFKQ